ncbi:unnamed protein product [Ceratitis capitata]|uniref:(Mediterranean fruit fly) hypothetical protein n=1 Tax=Ceratitis capitata TaxID=7213 RepID=A0A811UDN8_CERCA|nr:unnamed protein product [Ceratitis capitata]
MEDALDIIHVIGLIRYLLPSYHRYLNTRLKRAKVPTYLYRFDLIRLTLTYIALNNVDVGVRGVAHVDDLSYIFYMPESYKLPRDSEEFHTIELMMDYLLRSLPNPIPMLIA